MEEFNGRVNQICDLQRIKDFSTFASNIYNIIERRLMCADVKIFAEFLSNFLEKDFVDPKKVFESVCKQYQFGFLLLYDLRKE